jgi:NAD(P)-dependent dehydrogenase (short-subunit alcohol dehydrogenase family)
MQDFSGKIAVVTGGGTGIGRALVQQLAREGCSVAMCDISEEDMAECAKLAEAEATQGAKIMTFQADVANEDQINAFRDHVVEETGSEHIHLLFNNAGVAGGGSFVAGDRDQWERTFNVCWNGVYNNARAFMPLLVKASEGHIINVSSVNGFWASLGPDTPHTSYCAAKFAVKGFTEALMTDLAIHAPHVKASVVMPGHIGTSIALNSLREHGVPDSLPGAQEEDPALVQQRLEDFRDNGMPPAEAAQIIIDGVKEDKWRILVGQDAILLDAAVRTDPEAVYTAEFAAAAFPTMDN